MFPKDSRNLQRFVDWTESQFDTVKFSCFTTSECETESTYVLISNGIPVLPPPRPPPPSAPPRVQDGSITTTQIDELVDVVFVQFDADSNGWLNNTEYDAFSSAVYTSTLRVGSSHPDGHAARSE